jgi:hypothetical protein
LYKLQIAEEKRMAQENTKEEKEREKSEKAKKACQKKD